MAIISAGVIMNVIFAFLMAVVAFGIGVPEPPCVVGQVFAGEAAWQADLRPGDEILEIAGKKMKKFRDLQTAITLGDIDPEKGVPFLDAARRQGADRHGQAGASRSAFLRSASPPKPPRNCSRIRKRGWCSIVMPSFPARRPLERNRRFCNGDQIVQIDGTPIKNYDQINAEFARNADRKIEVAVERAERKRRQGRARHGGSPPDHSRRAGTHARLGPGDGDGPITAIQADSPAAAAGIQPGDRIVEPDGDPMTLPDRLARQAGKTIELKLEREKGKAADYRFRAAARAHEIARRCSATAPSLFPPSALPIAC